MGCFHFKTQNYYFCYFAPYWEALKSFNQIWGSAGSQRLKSPGLRRVKPAWRGGHSTYHVLGVHMENEDSNT